MKGLRILLAALLAMALVPASALAQETASSFSQLLQHETLAEGRDITITFRYEPSAGYEEIKTKVVRLDASTLTVLVDRLPEGRTDLSVSRREGRYGRWEIEIPEHRVQGIVLAGEGMPRWAGGLIGAGAGYGAAMLVVISCINANETGSGCDLGSPDALALGLIGGGAALGALLTGKSAPEVVYLSDTLPEQRASRLQWSLAPVMAKNQKAAVFSIQW
jgi:hypothetical protein